ncbi:protein MIZU-KUSSEI 1 [Dendrobium catenatum]|uniref:Protein MIZU-KUSSEI 1 n=1 Tax=Dendrobium catenatum TaxID=906689 RepID=A0A2I0W5H0_9ASPA|nr:protein MIZU-KUSSEI 1 [Dendrobium catenatum]PKU70909.1 hypothetical protein MA16_Dca027167 [Dendrobium catenatum]
MAASSSSSAVDDLENPSRPIIPRTPSLLQPSRRPRHAGRHNPLRLFRSICRTLPIFNTPRCGLPHSHDTVNASPARVTGTLFGNLRGRVSLSIQESPRCLPWVVLEMAVQTQVLMREMGTGMVRIALECERAGRAAAGRRVMEEGMWGVFYNGRKCGYAVRREATKEDLALMELLRAVSMGAGVLPDGNGRDKGEVAYLRACFEYVMASKDSETLYLLSPEDTNGPELSIFFVRI